MTVDNTILLNSFTVKHSVLNNQFKLAEYTASSSVTKIEINNIVLNGGTQLLYTTLFSIAGTVTDLDMT